MGAVGSSEIACMKFIKGGKPDLCLCLKMSRSIFVRSSTAGKTLIEIRLDYLGKHIMFAYLLYKNDFLLVKCLKDTFSKSFGGLRTSPGS